MSLLLILLSVMSWTVDSKNSASGEGTMPEGMQGTYACSYQKGTVRAGDEAVLCLSKLGGITVEKIEVWLKSNKDAGAGVFEVFAGEKKIGSKEGSLKDWYGSFDNVDYHPVSLLDKAYEGVDVLTIRLTGTANSLYIWKYVITYSAGAPRTVTLMRGVQKQGELTETQGGAGVILPESKDTADWHFIGWSETEFWAITTPPNIYSAGSKYYPSSDCSLWAVYHYDPNGEKVYATDLESGDYLYVNRDNNTALSGVPNDGKMTSGKVSPSNPAQVYTITFPDSKDTAYIVHKETNTPIGHSGKSMADSSSPWRVYHNGDETLFYTTINGKNYIFWLNVLDISQGTGTMVTYAGLLEATPVNSPMALLPVKQAPQGATYTCHPETPMDIDTVPAARSNGESVVMHFGAYDLIIKDGRKYLKMKNER